MFFFFSKMSLYIKYHKKLSQKIAKISKEYILSISVAELQESQKTLNKLTI